MSIRIAALTSIGVLVATMGLLSSGSMSPQDFILFLTWFLFVGFFVGLPILIFRRIGELQRQVANLECEIRRVTRQAE